MLETQQVVEMMKLVLCADAEWPVECCRTMGADDEEEAREAKVRPWAGPFIS